MYTSCAFRIQPNNTIHMQAEDGDDKHGGRPMTGRTGTPNKVRIIGTSSVVHELRIGTGSVVHELT